MKKPPLASVTEALHQKNFRVYDTPTVDWNLNIVGIRSKVSRPDKFDDWLVVFHKFGGEWDARFYQITTDPSPFYLKDPINPKGTAILKEGQYINTYALDIHNASKKGAHKALCQRLGDVTVYRDQNEDGVLDLSPEKTHTGRFGINIHRGPRNGQWTENNTLYSAGCQVFADDRKFDEFLLICQNGVKAFGNKFTYTLINEKDLPEL